MRLKNCKLFDAIAASYPLKLSECSFDEELPGLLPALIKSGFLQPDQPGLEVVCPALPKNCLVTAEPMNGRYYVHCECSEEVGLVRIDPKELRRFRFDLRAFLSWLISSAVIDADLREIESGELWYLGDKKLKGETAQVYFSRTQDRDKVIRLQREVHKDGNPPIIFWLGETPRRKQFPPGILSLPEIVSVSEKGFVFDRKPLESLFKKRLIVAAKGDILLDKDIVLRKKGEKCFLLFGQEDTQQFVEEVPILPQAYKIIRHLYVIRRYKTNAESLAELINVRGLASQRSTISNRISEINQLCKKHNVPPILHSFPTDKWGLNRILTCCSTPNER